MNGKKHNLGVYEILKCYRIVNNKFYVFETYQRQFWLWQIIVFNENRYLNTVHNYTDGQISLHTHCSKALFTKLRKI